MLPINTCSQISALESKSKRGIWQLRLLSLVFLCLPGFVSCVHSQSFLHYDKHISVIEKWIGQRETNGKNRSPLIDSMNRYCKSAYGNPYCAACQCYGLYLSGKPIFKTALAYNLKNKDTFSALEVILGRKKIYRGDLLIWQKGETINGHAASAYNDWYNTKGETIEGNTSSGIKGSQSDGDGFWKRTRSIDPTSYFRIKWITPIRNN